MNAYPEPFERLLEELQRLPTVGPKTALRLAFHLLEAPPAEVEDLARALSGFRVGLGLCQVCGHLSEGSRCGVCQDPRRDGRCLCVVATPREVMAIERTREYHGLYHVLGGLISPLDGIGPEQLALGSLVRRLESGGIQEVILATNPTVAGEATALFVGQMLEGQPVKVSRLAFGLPMGADLDHADELTLGRSLSARRPL